MNGPRLGIGILCYYDVASVRAHAASVDAHLRVEALKHILDNSENDEVGEWARTEGRGWLYHRFPYNSGCARPRNWFLARCAARGMSHILVQDQDVAWAGDAAAAMLDVFERYPRDTGCVTWRLPMVQMAGYRAGNGEPWTWDSEGRLHPSQAPGMCCMFSIEALLSGDDPDLRGWCDRYFVYRFDTDVCLALKTKGYCTRVVLHGPNLVQHVHPHQGQARLPNVEEHRKRSLAIFAERSARYKWPMV